MDDNFKKLCACGAMAVVFYTSTSLCLKCLVNHPADLPFGNEPATRASFNNKMVVVSNSGISSTVATAIAAGIYYPEE